MDYNKKDVEEFINQLDQKSVDEMIYKMDIFYDIAKSGSLDSELEFVLKNVKVELENSIEYMIDKVGLLEIILESKKLGCLTYLRVWEEYIKFNELTRTFDNLLKRVILILDMGAQQ